MKKTRQGSVIYIISLMIVFLMIGALFWYIYNDYTKRKSDINAVEAVAKEVVQKPKEEPEEGFDENLLRRIDFNKLWQTNTDAKRWLFVPGTKIDAPVMNENKVGSYFYDLRGFDKHWNNCGSFLVPKAPPDSKGNEIDDGHLFILGHRMNSYNGEWQFSNLPTRWGTKDGADAHPYVYVYYKDHAERYRVWTAIDARPSDMIYDIPTEIGSKDYDNVLKHTRAMSRYETDVLTDKNIRTLYMSTCNQTNRGSWIRFVLVSVQDATYDYQTGEYIDISDKHKENLWKDKFVKQRLELLKDLEPIEDDSIKADVPALDVED